jgi:hypothetical protein
MNVLRIEPFASRSEDWKKVHQLIVEVRVISVEVRVISVEVRVISVEVRVSVANIN